MAGYNERLRKVTERRDIALAKLQDNGEASVAIVSEKAGDITSLVNSTVQRTGDVASREIEHAKEAVSSQIDHAGNMVSDKFDHAQTLVKDQINSLENTLNPANIIRAHPWMTTIGAVVIGAAIVPLIRSRQTDSSPQPALQNIAQIDDAAVQDTAPSWFQPITDAVLANVRSAAIEIITHQIAAVTTKLKPKDPTQV